MNRTQIAIVRCVPDPVRDEPRNVGVIAWHDGEVHARFVGEDDAGDMDRRRIPRQLVGDRSTYADWVDYWRAQLKAGEVDDVVRGQRVHIGDESFIEAMTNVTRGGFEIRRTAEALPAGQWSVKHIAEQAFERFVISDEVLASQDEQSVVKARHRQLAYNAERALRRNNYREERDFVRDYSAFGKTTKGHRVPARFDLAIVNQPDLITKGVVLLVDAVSLIASKSEHNEVVDRARAVVTKVREVRNDQQVHVRALISNGTSAQSDVGRYATQILEEDGGVETVTIESLVSLVPKVRQGLPF